LDVRKRLTGAANLESSTAVLAVPPSAHIRRQASLLVAVLVWPVAIASLKRQVRRA